MASPAKDTGFIQNIKRAFTKSIKTKEKHIEDGARRAVVEQLFYDFNTSRSRVYWLNFFRGIFFGVGSVIGGTLVVALLVSILSLFTDMPGILGDFIQYIVDVVNVTTRR